VVVAVTAGGLAAVTGRAVAALWGGTPSLPAAIVALTVAGCAMLVVFVVVSYVMDKRDVRPAINAGLSRLWPQR
jgi:hypothetical protein